MPRRNQNGEEVDQGDGGSIMGARMRASAAWLFVGGVLLGAVGGWLRLPHAWTTVAAQLAVRRAAHSEHLGGHAVCRGAPGAAVYCRLRGYEPGGQGSD